MTQNRNTLVFFTSLATILIFAAAAFISCNKSRDLVINGTNIQPCKNKNCYNGAACLDGICNCPAGYEGDSCTIKWNERYPADYLANDACFSGVTKNVSINALSNTTNQIAINGVQAFGISASLIANIEVNHTNLVLPVQQVGADLYVSGKGTQTEGKSGIHLWLNLRDSLAHTGQNCSIVLTRK
jgi:hypothetical protein